MDLSYYLSEILEKQGSAVVPGLGYFTKLRAGAYYNAEQSQFYPSRNEIQLEVSELHTDDEALAQYISAQKGISLSSANFFIQQFVNNAIQDAAIKEVAIGSLGWLYTHQSKLAFRANYPSLIDASSFGLPAIPLSGPNQPATQSLDSIPDLSLKIADDNKEAENVEPIGEEFDDEERSSTNWGKIILLSVVVLAIMGAAFYFYNYGNFGGNKKQTATNTTSAIATDSLNKEDSSKSGLTTKNTDTATSPSGQVIDTSITPGSLEDPVKQTVITQEAPSETPDNTDKFVWHPTFAIIGGTFESVKKATNSVRIYQKQGIQAFVAQMGENERRQLVILGAFQTRSAANNALEELKQDKKISSDVYIKVFN